ncbi:tetratricopeptide repeat protein [Bradyrhizobium sp. CIAT3101]|uniref:tetratricopeptide repeat protein n=1 Tax=Bradyrhizobium sp. CIAT3101 TaxID=439387 RepID=UPI0024B0AB02|nr:tetratricopeptide repeat protein [Bradyrhizobium sp. CIAT3101]WFU82455.1 tetratricopeptide repeat protein [Bradyrhizobium sp. CIAT3101]
MIDPSGISAPAIWPAASPLTLTDGTIALLNLQAQIDGLEGHWTSAETATLIDLLILRGLILGRISDYERAAELANRAVGAATVDAAAYMARARTRAVFHRFAEALDDLDNADRMSPDDATAKRERAVILQAQGRYHESLAAYATTDDRVSQFERSAALTGLWAERGEADTAQRRYLDSLRSYRGISPFPVALLDFQLGVMWMRHQRLEEARTCFEVAIARVPAYAPAQGHLAEVEADLGNPESALTRLYPLAVSSDDPDYAAQLARILGEMGRDDESSVWRRRAADRYDELTATHREAFADHAAEFWLGPGKDPEKGLRLATLNLEVRETPRARELLAQAIDANIAGATSARCFSVT